MGALLAGAAALPLAYLAVTVASSAPDAAEAVWQQRTLRLMARSGGLALAVTAAAITVALPLAWLTARTDLPLRRAWTVALALPLVIPSYIGAYLLVSALGPRGLLFDLLEGPFSIERLPAIYGFPGAWLALTIVTYPLVLLPVRAALRRLDPQLEEAARGMGRSGWQMYRSVVLPQLVPAIGAGALLVSLYVLSDFGAVSITRFDSFTRSIYTSYRASFDRAGAAALSSLLVIAMLGILWLEARTRRGGGLHRAGPGTARPAGIVALGGWRWPALAICAGVTAIALALPIGVLVYWSTQSFAGTVDWAEIAAAARNSVVAAGIAALVAAICAIPIALLAARHPSRASSAIERLSYTGYALPGIVVALALVFFGIRVVPALYQSLAMLVFALVVLLVPLAIGTIRASLLQISPRLEEAAQGMGRGRLSVLRTVTGPLAAGGVLAGGALVFLTAVKELPATLLLSPIGFDTLATEIWRTTSVGFFERGAIPSLVLLAVSVPWLYLLAGRD